MFLTLKALNVLVNITINREAHSVGDVVTKSNHSLGRISKPLNLINLNLEHYLSSLQGLFSHKNTYTHEKWVRE